MSAEHQDARTVTFRISGVAFSSIEGSEIYYNAEKYDGGSQGAHDALAALHSTERIKTGKGVSYKVTTTPAGAETIEEFCRTVGETFAMESEPETRADGRALLVVADRIKAALTALGRETST